MHSSTKLEPVIKQVAMLEQDIELLKTEFALEKKRNDVMLRAMRSMNELLSKIT